MNVCIHLVLLLILGMKIWNVKNVYKKLTKPPLDPNKVNVTIVFAIESTEAQNLSRNWKFWVCFNFEDKMIWTCEAKKGS